MAVSLPSVTSSLTATYGAPAGAVNEASVTTGTETRPEQIDLRLRGSEGISMKYRLDTDAFSDIVWGNTNVEALFSRTPQSLVRDGTVIHSQDSGIK
jgi:hypothetical protein